MNRTCALLVFSVLTGGCLTATPGRLDVNVEECRSRAAALFREGRIEDTIGVSYQCVAEARERGATGSDLALALNDLATLYHDSGRLAEADRAYAEALRIWRSLGGSESYLLPLLRNMAGLRISQGRYAEAERFYREAEQSAMALFAGPSPEVADVWNGLAELYFRTGRLRQAREWGQRALTVFQANGQDARAGLSLFVLANVAWKEGATPDTESLLRAAITAWESSLGKRHQSYGSGLASLAVCLSRSNPDEADSLFRQALAILEVRLGEKHSYLGFVMLQYARHLEAHGRKNDGKNLKRRAELILSSLNPLYQPGQTIDLMSLRP